MSDRRVFRWATTSARALAGTLVATAFVVAIVTAVAIPWPTVAHEPVQIVAVPAPAASVLACQGPLLVLGRDAASAGSLTAAARQHVAAGVREGATAAAESELTTPVDGAPASVFTAAPEDRTRTDVAASGSASVSAEDLSGYAASACRPPLLESWLVGGATTTGASDLVVVGNPGEVASAVQLTVYGTGGPTTPPGGEFAVAPHAQVVVALAGLALGEANPVIRVSATGAAVVASLQTSLTRTLVPGGVDQVGAIALPDPHLVIPGVAVTQGGDQASGEAATLFRLLSPAAETVASVTITPVGGAAEAQATLTVPLPAGVPVDLDLSSVPVGEYVVQVDAGQGIVGAVWHTTGFGEGSDFAWYTPAPEIGVPSLVAVPDGPPAVVTVVNPSAATIDVALDATDGSSTTAITLAPGRSARLSVRPGTVYALDAGDAPLRAAVSLTGAGAVAGFPVWSADAGAQPITVYP